MVRQRYTYVVISQRAEESVHAWQPGITALALSLSIQNLPYDICRIYSVFNQAKLQR